MWSLISTDDLLSNGNARRCPVHAAQRVDNGEAKKQIMVTIARFATESALLPAWERYLEEQLGADFLKKEKAKATPKKEKKEKAS